MRMTQMAGVPRNGTPVVFRETEHLEFYRSTIRKCLNQDERTKALVYCLGISRKTREHADRVYSIGSDSIHPECLEEAWQNSGSRRIVRLAFNLYCDGAPTVSDMIDPWSLVKECREYFPGDLFSCEYAPYFCEAIRIRFPEYFDLKSAV